MRLDGVLVADATSGRKLERGVFGMFVDVVYFSILFLHFLFIFGIDERHQILQIHPKQSFQGVPAGFKDTLAASGCVCKSTPSGFGVCLLAADAAQSKTGSSGT
jgi:hypothetical protein